MYKPDKYTDVYDAMIVGNSKSRRFYAVNEKDVDITRDQVSQMIGMLSDNKLAYDVFIALLLSPTYCHTVINNPSVLTKLAPILEKNKIAYGKALAYAFFTLYAEECIFKTQTKKENRYVFDINTASKLPYFPYTPDDIHQSPYLNVLVDEKQLDSKNNCLSYFMSTDNELGICTFNEFKSRFNIFTTGDPTKNILEGIDWNSHAVSGSIIPACLQKNSPLMDIVTNSSQNETTKFKTFCHHYYNDSDIDLMNNKESIFDFLDSVQDVSEKIRANIASINNIKLDEVKLEIEPQKSLSMNFHQKYIEERLEHIKEHTGHVEWTVENVIENIKIKNPDVKEYFYALYVESKLKNNQNIRKTKMGDKKNPLFNHYMKISSLEEMDINMINYNFDKESTTERDSDSYYYVNDYRADDKKVPHKDNLMILKICENLKFNIKSPQLLHTVQIFRVKSKEFFNVVAKFHLPCVRAYYTNDNVYILPSCVAAMMTGINIDYKYFAGIKDPIDILNKYRYRGFGTLINAEEKQCMTIYNGNVNKWKGMFSIDPSNKESIQKHFGCKELTDNIFKPLVFLQGLPKDVYKDVNKKYLKTIDDLKKHYEEKYKSDLGINVFKFKAINSAGYVEPAKKWIFEALYSA
jgi:hypothetical protein